MDAMFVSADNTKYNHLVFRPLAATITKSLFNVCRRKNHKRLQIHVSCVVCVRLCHIICDQTAHDVPFLFMLLRYILYACWFVLFRINRIECIEVLQPRCHGVIGVSACIVALHCCTPSYNVGVTARTGDDDPGTHKHWQNPKCTPTLWSEVVSCVWWCSVCRFRVNAFCLPAASR